MKKNTDNKEENIKIAIEKLEKKYGTNTVMQMNKNNDFKVEWISTGCISLDEIIGQGLPRCRIMEIAGVESGGKSTLALFLISQIQKQGGKAAFIDAEFAFDGKYSSNIGVDVSKLFLSQPESLEEGMDVLRELINTNAFDIIVIDSVAALVPKSEIEEKEMLKTNVAVQARLLGKALRILSSEIANSKTIVIFLNQLREKIGIFFGDKTVTPGGRALKFFASVRLDVKKGKKITNSNDVQIGNQIICTAVKNKVGFPWKKTTLDLYYAKGIDLLADALDFGEKVGVITKEGLSFIFNDFNLGVGREKAINTLAEDPKLFKELQEAITNKLKKKNND